MKNIQLDRTAKTYILGAISNEGYSDKELTTDKEKLQFLYNTFKSEYSFQIDRLGEFKAFSEWLQGLPSSFNIDFTNYNILTLAKDWRSLPSEPTERQEQKILDNWWNFITNKTFQLFRKHKIGV